MAKKYERGKTTAVLHHKGFTSLTLSFSASGHTMLLCIRSMTSLSHFLSEEKIMRHKARCKQLSTLILWELNSIFFNKKYLFSTDYFDKKIQAQDKSQKYICMII